MTLHQQEFGITLLAVLGGLIVLIGLQMEHGATKNWFSHLSDIKKQKSKGKWGHILVIVGIALETSVGGFFAWQEVFEMWRYDPNNQTISSVTILIS